MKKNVLFSILILTLFITNITYSQFFPEGQNIQNQRMKWFIEQRRFPNNDSIPLDAYWNAIQSKLNRRQLNGFFLNTSSNWVAMGPAPGIYDFNGSVNGRCQSVYIDTERDATGGTVYVVGANGGLWKTTNAWTSNPLSVSWSFISMDVPVTTSGSFAVYSNPGQPYPVIYYGTGEDIDYTTQFLGVGIFKTTNDGQSWVRANGLPNSTKVFKIAIKPDDPNTVLAALGNQYYSNGNVDCGLYRSTDAGLNWVAVPGTERLHCTDLAFSPDDPQRAYLTGPLMGQFIDGPGYRISTDGGETFTQKFNTGLVILDRTLVEVSRSQSNIVFVLSAFTDTTGQYVKAYKSTDYGESFVQVGGKIPTYPNFNTFIKVSPFNSNIVFVGGIDLWKSIDGVATNFVKITSVYGSGGNYNVHPDQHNMHLFPTQDPNNENSNKFLLTNDGGIYRSTDYGTSFEFIGNNILTFEFYKVASDPFDHTHLLAAALDNGLQHRSLGTNYWSFTAPGDYSSVLFSMKNPDNLIHIPCKVATLMYSVNGGAYSSASNFYTGDVHSWVIPMTATSDGDFYTANNAVFKSTNNGQSWNPISNVFVPNSAIEQLAVSDVNPNFVYATLVALNAGIEENRIYLTTNGGSTWGRVFNDLPNKRITSIKVDPVHNNQLYVTLSGFINGGFSGDHVYKSTNSGTNWSSITGLEDVPVNDIHIRYTNCTNRQFIVATDIGVYVYDESVGSWSELGSGLPNAPCLNLQFNRLTNKFTVGTFGIGAWQIKMDGDIYINDKMYIAGTNSKNYVTEISDNIVVCSGGRLLIPGSCTVKMATGKRIIVESGGIIEAETGASITFTSQSGTWGGIEFHGTGSGTLSNVTFQNTATPIVAESDGGGDIEHPDILIDNCFFNNAPVQITGRPNVTVSNSQFDYTSGEAPAVLGVISTGSDNIDINRNSILSSASISSAGISVIYGTGVSVRNNIIQNMGVGISLSNSDAFVEGNSVSATDEPGENIGIGADNSYSGAINSNYVSNYYYGIKLLSSSPTMLSNNIVTSISNSYGIYCTENSSPRLRPDAANELVVWDAGLNTINNSSNVGLFAYETSVPDLDRGCNTFTADRLYVDIALNWPVGLDPVYYYIRNNTWEAPFSEGKIHIDNPFIYEPTGCYQERGGGGIPSAILDNPEPPQPFVVDYGNGIYDTLNTSTSNNVLSTDQSLYHQGIKKELSGDFIGAVELYKNVVSGYRDSLSAIGSLKRILKCNDRMNSDSSAYSQLRAYYLGLAATYQNDTDFSYISQELATKCLVRSTKYPAAITEYENSISGSNDSLRILNAELNIIETYMLIPPPPGDAPGFTGRLVSLKPAGIMDGFRMLKEKLYRFNESHGSNVIPEKFSLSQNYPNPFNPLTKISFSLPNAGKVTLKVYDILGRTVKELVNEFKDKGVYSVTFDGTGLASGVYFYTIEAGTFKETKKMVLVK